MYRLLITGARDLADPTPVYEAIRAVHARLAVPLVVVHGDCPTGADAFARAYVEEIRADGYSDIDHEPHPADWRAHGRAAGPIRNAAMVAAGADHCLAFPLPGSRGTRNCLRLAREAGIPTTAYAVTEEN